MDPFLSSPDPLNDSPTYQSPVKTRQSARVRHSLPLQGSSPTKQTFELDVGNRISPQKIRVTVEAGHSDTEHTYTRFVDTRQPSPSPVRRPVVRRKERTTTTTTTVPVKGLSDSEDDAVPAPKQGRGRPRKSVDGTPKPAKKHTRAGTPVKNKGKRKPIGSQVDGDDEDDTSFQLGQGVEVARGKGRSRSRSIKGASRKSTPAPKQTEASDISSTASKGGRGRRKTLVPDELISLEDENNEMNVENGSEEPEMSRTLSSANSNIDYAPSEYSTIRSTTTVREDAPDIIIARFDPGNETPRGPGWSSPHVVDVPSSSTRERSIYPSPSMSHEKTPKSLPRRNCMPEEQLEEHVSNQEGEGEPNMEMEDGGDGYQDFDTILESEGFSMISVDSVPSLREHLSSPASQTQEAEPVGPIIGKIIGAVQEAEAADNNDSFPIPEQLLEAATPSRKYQNPQLLSVQNSRIDDSFSSIPPDILEAATPAKKTMIYRLLGDNSRLEDSFSSIAPEILEAATPGRDLTRVKSSPARAFSTREVPSSVISNVTLDASPSSKPSSKNIPGNAFSSLIHSSQTLSSNRRIGQGTATARLPTPEETPSPPREEYKSEKSSAEATDSFPVVSVDQNPGNESSMFPQMRSSPP
jgi:serine/arginine repetitive matrix protein 2